MTERDPNGIDPHAPGAKLDEGKIRPWLCIAGFSLALAEVAKVTTKGAEKYSDNGWMTVPNGSERYMDAFARHMLAVGRGEMIDADTGCRHKAQMIWDLLASLELELRAPNKRMTATESMENYTSLFNAALGHFPWSPYFGSFKDGLL